MNRIFNKGLFATVFAVMTASLFLAAVMLLLAPRELYQTPVAEPLDNMAFVQCMKEAANPESSSRCYPENQKSSFYNSYSQVIDWTFNQLLETRLFIQMVYVIIFLMIFMQTRQFLLVQWQVSMSSTMERFYTSEWTVNVPTTAGIMGTLFAFAMLASSAENVSELIQNFRDNVYAMVSTSLFGGLAYIWNSYLSIKVLAERSDQ